MYPFGLKVRVNALVKPVYITWVDEVDVKVPMQRNVGSSNSGYTAVQMYQHQKKKLPQQEMRQVTPSGYKSELTGEKVDKSHPVPQDGGRHRRLRRYPCNKLGVVIGYTWKAEGKFGRDDINFLMENQRHKVYKLALDTSPPTGHAWTADIGFALVEDINPYSL